MAMLEPYFALQYRRCSDMLQVVEYRRILPSPLGNTTKSIDRCLG
jgi:hypothetical protein